MMKSRRGKLSHHHNVANSRNANPTVADASQRNFIDVFVLRWPAGRSASSKTNTLWAVRGDSLSVSRIIAPFSHETHTASFERRVKDAELLCVRFQGFLAVEISLVGGTAAKDALCALKTTGCFGQMESNASANSLHTRKMRSKMLIINSTATLL